MSKCRSLHVFETIPKTLICSTLTQLKLLCKFIGKFIHSCMTVSSPINAFLHFENVKSAHVNHAKPKAVHEDKHPSLAQACAPNDNTQDKC